MILLLLYTAAITATLSAVGAGVAVLVLLNSIVRDLVNTWR